MYVYERAHNAPLPPPPPPPLPTYTHYIGTRTHTHIFVRTLARPCGRKQTDAYITCIHICELNEIQPVTKKNTKIP